jgi:WhiB family transcriptional regulator, redox-sensing transcriptional regulator
MLTTGVPRADGAQDAQGGEAVATLLDSAPAVGCGLPCRRDPDLWFAESPGQLEEAKTLCADCPIKTECLAGALSRGEPWGVWGGEIVERGAVIARKRPRGRPRKNPVPSSTGGRREQAA